ncbi:MAG: type II toxin-antitoxin system RelE/ParE family toxin [Pirellulales bacterium]
MEVLVTASALEEFTRLPRPIQTRVLQLVERLSRWPRVSGAKPLTGELAGRFRLRTGDYRIQFHVEARAVIVERMGHRDGFYDG